MKKILFPTDFSECAANAFQYTVHLAQNLGAQLDVVSVYHLPFTDAGNVPPEMIQQMLKERRNQTESQLKSFIAEAKKTYDAIGTYSLYGVFISTEIIDHAGYNDYDLIAMGTKGQRNAIEKMLGSVTTQTMMHAKCPVLAIPSDAQFGEGIQHIAFATAFEKSDHNALSQLLSFAEMMNASIHFVHVETSPGIGKEDEMIEMKDYPNYFTDFTIVNSKSISKGVERFLKEKQQDLLALFIPKRRLWERLFHHSVSKEITFQAQVPLLVFHE